MKPLSGVDNLFLQLEHGNQHMHVAGLGIYDQSTAPDGALRFKQILDFFSRRLNKFSIFRRRLVVPPFNIDRPYWIEDGALDVEYHVRHIALPAPGDWRQLMIQVARIHSRPLDRSKPLWEAYVIEGLNKIPDVAPNSFALYIKCHHAAVDGEAGARLLQAIHSLTSEPDAADEMPGQDEVVFADREPTTLELCSRALASRSSQLLDAGKLLAGIGGKAARAGLDLATSGKLLATGTQLLARRGELTGSARPGKGGLGRKPLTRFDQKLSPHRVVDATGIALADCQTIREHVADVTINDIFLATCGGAVRRYLAAKNELPERSLSALMPISTRSEKHGATEGNQLAMVPVPLRSDIADPLARLHAVRRGARTSKGASSLLGHDFAARLIQVVPLFAAEAFVSHGLVPLCNATVSNVRGPATPLYMAGARLQVYLPVSIAFDGIGLNMTGFSYNGMLRVCFVACRDMLPDPAFFSECLAASFAEILAAARKLPRLGEAAGKVPATRSRKPRVAAGTDAGKPRTAPAKPTGARKKPKPKAAAATGPATGEA